MHTHPLRWGRTSDSLTHIPKTALWISLQDTELHTHTHVRGICVLAKKQPHAAATRLRAPLNSMTHFSQLGLAGRARSCTLPWIIGTARWMWGEWLKTGDPSPVPSLRLPALLSAGCAPAPVTPALSWSRCCSHQDWLDLMGQMKTCGRWNQSGALTIRTIMASRQHLL